MIRQKSNGFFIPDEKISVDMDIVISSLKVPYLRVSYYGTEQLSIPDGQTLSFTLDDEEIKLSSKRESNRLKKGNDYLNPNLDIIADESLSEESKSKLIKFLSKWLTNYINEVLGDLVKLTKYKITNQYSRGLVFQLYENNGVIKRSEIDKIVKLIPLEERKKLWGMGVKIGRYHIYLPKMLKPKAVEFRIGLWKIFHNLSGINKIPKSGLNFLIGNNLEKNFYLLCGFEKFREFFVRIDILEKLFLKIIDNTKNKKFKINAEMMNLLGCSKENFYKLMTYMNYKKDKTVDTYIFKGEKKRKEKIIQFDKKENPFNKLLSLNLK